jgi:hypothetical protein
MRHFYGGFVCFVVSKQLVFIALQHGHRIQLCRAKGAARILLAQNKKPFIDGHLQGFLSRSARQ